MQPGSATSRDGALCASNVLNILGLLAISLALGTGFAIQLVLGELPCPLCQLQRVGLILIGIGFMMNVRFGVSPAQYGMLLLGAVITGAIATRQVLLNILPGKSHLGISLMGLQLYTWVLLAAVATVIGVALLLVLQIITRQPRLPAWHTWIGKFAVVLFVALVAASLGSTILQCGTGGCGGTAGAGGRYLLLS